VSLCILIIIASSLLTTRAEDSKSFKIFKDDVEAPETAHHFLARPLKYLHADWLPEEAKKLDRTLNGHPKVKGDDNCELTIQYLDYEDYYQLMMGFTYGLVDHPNPNPDQCQTCAYLGDVAGSIQEGLIGLTVTRAMWRDYREILNLDFWHKTSRLLFVYLILVSVLLNLDKGWKYSPLQILLANFLDKMNADAQLEMIMAVFNNWFVQLISMKSIPGKSCLKIGVRTGFAIRKLTLI